MARISVVVPVYNVEDCLCRCIDSILFQTFADFELICVNDGSTDNSLKILQQYQKFDERIKIISKENGGLSSARNAGIANSGGEYILFVDSDDYLSSVALEILYKNAAEFDADVVVFDYVEGDFSYTNPQYKTMPNYREILKNKVFNASLLAEDSYKYFSVTAWSKLYKADVIKNNNLKFCEGVYYEDVPFWSEIFTLAKSIIYVPEPLYFYNQGRQGSIMQKNDKRCFDVVTVYEKVIEIFQNNGLWDKYKHTVLLVTMMNFLKKFHIIKPELKKEFYDRIKNFKPDIDFSIYESDEYLDFERNYVRQFSTLETADFDTFCKIMGDDNNG